MKKSKNIFIAIIISLLFIFTIYLEFKERAVPSLSPGWNNEGFKINDTLAPLGANLAGTNTITFDPSQGAYYFEFRDSNHGLLTKYEININDPDVQKGILKVKESQKNIVLSGIGTTYRTPSGRIIEPEELAGSSSVLFNHEQIADNAVLFRYNEVANPENEDSILTKQYTLTMSGKTLIIKAEQINSPLVPNANYAGFSFGYVKSPINPRSITIPYMEIAPVTIINNQLFSSTYIDWSLSNSNYYPQKSLDYSSGNFKNSYSSSYVAKQNNGYNSLDETGYITISDNVEDLMMVPNRQPSPYRSYLNSRPVISVWHWWGDFPTSKSILDYVHNNLGFDDAAIVYNVWSENICGPPAAFPADPNRGGNAALTEFVSKAKSYGYLISLYEIFSDITASSPFWQSSQDKINLNPDSTKHVNYEYTGCPPPNLSYSLSREDSVYFSQQVSPLIKQTFNPNAAFTDVIPKDYMGPGMIDYATTNQNSNSIGGAMRTSLNLFDYLHSVYNGPLMGEGGQEPISIRGMYAGSIDALESEIVGREFAPIMPDYELKIIKPLMANQGMGMTARWVGDGSAGHHVPQEITNIDLDKYNAMTISYGHTGYMEDVLSSTNPLYQLSKYYVTEYYLFRELQERYLSSPVSSVLYYNSTSSMIDLNEALRQNLNFSNVRMKTSYSNGLLVYINRNPSVWTVQENGQSYYLPINGWLAIAPNFIEYSALVDNNGNPSISGHRVDYVSSPNYIFVNGRGIETYFGQDYYNNSLISKNIEVVKQNGWVMIELPNSILGGQFLSGIAFNFDMSNIPAINVLQGRSSSTQLQVTNISGQSENVNLYFSGQPNGVEITSDPQSCIPNCLFNIDISANSNASIGQHEITVVAVSAISHKVKSTSFILDVASYSSTSSQSGSGGGSSGGSGGSTISPQCSDNQDNDGDGKIDYPDDLGCDSRIDNDELDSFSSSQNNINKGSADGVNLKSDDGSKINILLRTLIILFSSAILIIAAIIIHRLIKKNSSIK